MSVAEGELLAGKYRVERVLGRGGMGVVVAAHHIVLDEKVAIKFLLPEAMLSGEAVARFEREARAAVKIKSEHVARVTDVGRLDTGAPYMVMELLRGRDLADLLQQRGPLPLEDVADYILQAGEAIAEAHGLGIVHRDLKPPNLFLTERADGSSCVKVLDFGISKVTNAGPNNDQGMTSTTAVMGSPLYMSPEQLMSARDVDMRTDVWALGVICYELLTGHAPFLAETLPQLCVAIGSAPPTPLRNYRSDLPPELEQLLLRCLEKDRGKRVATVAELAAQLVKFAPRRSRLSAERIERLARAAGFSASALALPPSSADGAAALTSASAASQTLGEFSGTRPGVPSSKLRAGLLIGVVVALGGAGLFALSHRAPVTAESVPASASPVSAAPPVEPSAAPVASAAPAAASDPTPAVQPSASATAASVVAPTKPALLSKPKPGSARPPAAAGNLPAKSAVPAAKSGQNAMGGRL